VSEAVTAVRAGSGAETFGRASEPITTRRSRLKRKLTWPPTTARPRQRCAKPTLRMVPSPWTTLATSSKSSTEAPGASSARCWARSARAARSAASGDATAPGTSMPLPHTRDGTPVSVFHSERQVPARAVRKRCQGSAPGARPARTGGSHASSGALRGLSPVAVSSGASSTTSELLRTAKAVLARNNAGRAVAAASERILILPPCAGIAGRAAFIRSLRGYGQRRLADSVQARHAVTARRSVSLGEGQRFNRADRNRRRRSNGGRTRARARRVLVGADVGAENETRQP
jgi:hypothetical protein